MGKNSIKYFPKNTNRIEKDTIYKNYRIKGRPGVDQQTFLDDIKPRVLNFFNQQKRSINQDPPIENVYSLLYECGISEDDFEHAKKVWKAFEMKTFRDYHNTYVISDTLQIADVFENFRKLCMKVFRVDPAHYYTAPGLFWDVLFKHTKHKQELLTDIDMHNKFEACTRGGYPWISKRFAKTNNKYMKNYDPKKEDVFLCTLRCQ